MIIKLVTGDSKLDLHCLNQMPNVLHEHERSFCPQLRVGLKDHETCKGLMLCQGYCHTAVVGANIHNPCEGVWRPRIFGRGWNDFQNDRITTHLISPPSSLTPGSLDASSLAAALLGL